MPACHATANPFPRVIILIIYLLSILHSDVFAADNRSFFSLSEVIAYALKNNPGIRQSGNARDIEQLNIQIAKAERMPRVDLNSGITRFRYPTAVTPITGSPLAGAGFPEFDTSIYDIGLSFRMPLFRGGRLERWIDISGIRASISEDMLTINRQELIYNLTSVYFRISLLEKLLSVTEATVKQMEEHRGNVELFLKAGTVPGVELLKTDLELARAQQNALLVRNTLETAYELLKTLMGLENINNDISLVTGATLGNNTLSYEEAVSRALAQRPDYLAVVKKKKLAEARIKYAGGKRLPDVFLMGEYTDRSGEGLEFRENWNLALRLTMPVFDGGSIKTDIVKEKKEREKIMEEEKALRLTVIREIKEAFIQSQNAKQRMAVSLKAIETAKENLRIESLKFRTGSNTSTDVLDAQSVLLQVESDSCQALYDNEMATAALMKAMGEDTCCREVTP
jgi:outer membrane protein